MLAKSVLVKAQIRNLKVLPTQCQGTMSVHKRVCAKSSTSAKECYRWIGSKSPCEVSDPLSGTEQLWPRARFYVCGQQRASNTNEHAYFFVTVIRSCVLK